MDAEQMREELALSLQNAIEAITGEPFSDDDALVLANDVMCNYDLEPR